MATIEQPPRDETLVGLLQRVHAAYAGQPALLFRDGPERVVWTYADLDRHADAFADLLRSREIRRGERVVIWAPNQPWWVAAFLGCVLEGVVAVPLDANGSPEFARRVMEMTQARLLIAGQDQARALGEVDVPAVPIQALASLTEGLPGGSGERPEIRPDDLVEVVYTSGTTGHPRGVMISHGNLLAVIRSLPAHLHGDPSYRMLSVLPLSHLFEQTVGLWYVLYCGARVVYVRSIQASTIMEALAAESITGMLVVPQVMSLFYNAMEREARRSGRERAWRALHRVAPWLPFGARRLLFRTVHRRLGGAFRLFVSGGAGLEPRLARLWENMGVAVVQGYGLTECAPVVAATSLARRPLGAVGRPIACCEVRIAPDGEILVHGANVTAGYWQDPAATADAFVEGWYRTGDLGLFDREGYLYLKGRKKNLIVLANGLNVYPEDIEAVLLRDPSVKDAIVVGVPRGQADVEVHAILVLNGKADPAAIVREANRQLAAHQRIGGFSLWPEPDFPRTPTLKAKRLQILRQFGLAGMPAGAAGGDE